MFNFLRKKEQPKEEQIKFRAEKALMDNPSFSLLLQLNLETENIFLQ